MDSKADPGQVRLPSLGSLASKPDSAEADAQAQPAEEEKGAPAEPVKVDVKLSAIAEAKNNQVEPGDAMEPSDRNKIADEAEKAKEVQASPAKLKSVPALPGKEEPQQPEGEPPKANEELKADHIGEEGKDSGAALDLEEALASSSDLHEFVSQQIRSELSTAVPAVFK